MEETKVLDPEKGAVTNISDLEGDLEIALGLNLECELDNDVVLKAPKASPALARNDMVASLKVSREGPFQQADERRDLFNNSRNFEGQSPKKGATTTHDLRELQSLPR
eukprot:CAMPEP_0170498130 /NCGR_PEP_ID=MMETSP0208-20121228/26929_1 /TAXON_ID=197538 /ORGANISM="Strombidium inclinatum, Strain S3" /LENGTH=107 /DNA_ID=CAMNT_0010775213 /DNA_START=226 /DNA_END=549 /DNA_ORIENTATION=-